MKILIVNCYDRRNEENMKMFLDFQILIEKVHF